MNHVDITRSLQHKYEVAMKLQKQHELLADLGALPGSFKKTDAKAPHPVATSPLAEPNPAVPLWRRVDKQFWWNEWMSKPFIELGVSSSVEICMPKPDGRLSSCILIFSLLCKDFVKLSNSVFPRTKKLVKTYL